MPVQPYRRDPFIDRDAELAWLRAAWGPGRPELGVLYGRRRVGKSALSDELAKIDEDGTKIDTALNRFSDLTREYLRDLSKLPNIAAEQFSAEIDRLSKLKTPRIRVARAKE